MPKPSIRAIQRLYAMSGNRCAFSGCTGGHRVEGTPDNAKREHFKNRMMAVTAGGR